MRPIALSGFMGAGKTTVGERLARSTGRRFVDLDSQIAAAFARPVHAVFSDLGEPAFRAMEARLLQGALAVDDRVVALGGGAVLDPDSRALLLERASWVHIDVPLGELRRRVALSDGDRPLWDDQVDQRFEARAPAYAEAPLRVDGDRPPGDVASAIEALVGSPSPAEPASAGELHRLRVEIPGEAYDIVIGDGLHDALRDEVAQIGEGPIALLADWNVGPLHSAAVGAALRSSGREVIDVALPAGEENKRVRPVLDAVDRLLDQGWQRSAPVVALGGGVLGDMAGLVAALLLRGVPVVQVPTTLLSMVDSSVGGKVGVNHRSGKNLVGTFKQPSLVVADLSFLRTLGDREYRAGLGEVVKTALLGDAELFERLEADPAAMLRRDPVAVADAVRRCCAFKAQVVAEDTKEQGLRRILNLGHTFGHALEAATRYARLLHGEAVAVGLVAAAELAGDLGFADPALADRIRRLLVRLGLPTSVPGVSSVALSQALVGDKKTRGDELTWVFVRALSDPVLVALPLEQRGHWLARMATSGVFSEQGV